MNREGLKKMKLVSERDQKTVISACYVAESLWTRTLGLMGEKSLDMQEGLLILRSNSIHTFFMKFAIDVVFLDASGKVVGIHPNVKPWKLDWPVFRARNVLELAGGAAQKLRIQKGDRLCLS